MANKIVCPGCGGSGCSRCNWKGTQKSKDFDSIMVCPGCGGSGCSRCNWKGTI